MKRMSRKAAAPSTGIRRRTFLKTGAAAAIGGVCAMPSSAAAEDAAPVVVVVHGTDPKKMVQAGIAKMGGWEKLFKPGAKVAIKPNLAWKSTPEPAALPLRISHRVLAGGHDVPTADVMRRYARSSANVKEYAALADSTLVFYAVPAIQRLIYRRNGDSLVLDSALAEPMRKELGI